MATEQLTSYLHDHIAGASMAIDVIELLQAASHEQSMSEFLTELLAEVQQDRLSLEQLAKEIAQGPSSGLKNSAAWLSAKALNLKLHAGKEPFGMFEAMEFLALGILGKGHLWKVLQRSSECNAAPCKLDFDRLMERAASQYARVEEHRLALAGKVL